MMRALLLSLLLVGCDTAELAQPPRGPCEGELPRLGDGSQRMVTFPPRDFRCGDGAGPVCSPSVPVRSDEERTVVVTDELGGIDLVYVLDQLSLPEAESRDEDGVPGTHAVGFDLDALDTGGGSDAPTASCAEFAPDHASAIEPGGGGVDNAFQGTVRFLEYLLDSRDCPGAVVEGCLDARLQRELSEGRLLLLLELTGVDSLEHDDAVRAALYLGVVSDGGPPPTVAGSLRFAPGQEFVTLGTVAEPAPADIFHGRLRARWSMVELPIGPAPYPRALADAELRAGLCPNGLYFGHLGGAMAVDDLTAQVVEELNVAIEETGARSVLESVADVRPTDDPAVCEQLSVGYALAGVPATRRR